MLPPAPVGELRGEEEATDDVDSMSKQNAVREEDLEAEESGGDPDKDRDRMDDEDEEESGELTRRAPVIKAV